MCWMTFPWPWPKVTAVALINKNLLICIIKWEALIQSLQNLAFYHGYYLIRFWRNSFEKLVVVFLQFGEQTKWGTIIVNIFCSISCTRYSLISNIAVFKFRIICHAQDLWKLARSCIQMHLLCPPDPWNLPGTALLSGFQNSCGALKSTEYDSM